MLHKPILSGRSGKWAYSLVEYDLAFEPLRAKKGQIVADFIVEHRIALDDNACLVELVPWKLFFDGSVCSRGQGIGYVIVSPNNKHFVFSARLEFACTNNQVEYEALLHGLKHLKEMGVANVEVFGDSLLVVQQVEGESKCSNGVLNSYLDECMDIVGVMDTFSISHIPRERNGRANSLAQQASRYDIIAGLFSIETEPALPIVPANRDEIDNGKANERPADRESESVTEATGGMLGRESAPHDHNGDVHGTSRVVGEKEDWRTALVWYLQDLGVTVDRKIRRQALKYTLLNNELYRRTIDGLLLKCLGEDAAPVAMGDVHEGLCKHISQQKNEMGTATGRDVLVDDGRRLC
jgi:ribonuclease HI